MKALSITAFVSATVLCVSALPALAADQSVPGVVVADRALVEATVVAIDNKTRRVTLKLPNGDLFDLIAGDEVKNLAQVRVGDAVKAEYRSALAMQLKKGSGIRSTSEVQDGARANPGQKPAAMAVREVEFVADVVDVDAKASVVTLKGAKGRIVKLKVQDPSVLAEIKQGDQVEGVYSEALAVSVTPKAAAKK